MTEPATPPRQATVPTETVYNLCDALKRLCGSADLISAESIAYALDRFAIPLPSRSPVGADRTRAAAAGRAVVIGQYSDRSGWADFCYGPYDRDRAEAVAELLTAGNWHSMQWLVIPVGVLPGGES